MRAGSACQAPDPARILALLRPPAIVRRVEAYPLLDSTNRAAAEAAARGEAEGLVVVAGAQNAGRGRKGRAFHSPAGTGLYMSVLLRPALPLSDAPLLTPAAAVAVAEAVERVAGRAARIKWVNDVLLDGKKVCGILTETACDVQSGRLTYAVLGIGVNLTPPDGGFPREIADTAGALFARGACPPEAAERLAAAILNAFSPLYAGLGERAWLDAYIARSSVIGRRVQVLSAQGGREAIVTGVDRDARLLVRYADGSEEALASGEISVRGTE